MRMPKSAWLIAVFSIIIISCQKEVSIDSSAGGVGGGGGNGNAEVGTWKFIGLKVSASSTVELNDGINNVKTVTLSEYTTADNDGTIKFNGSIETSSDLTYSVDFPAKTYYYDNGVLQDSIDFPIAFTLPPTSSSVSYRKIGSDSLYFDAGLINVVGGGSIQATASGYKLKFEGDKMYMTTVVNEVKSQTDQGISQKTTNHAVAITTLQKM